MKHVVKFVFLIIDFLAIPLTIISALWLKFIRRYNVGLWETKSIVSKKILHIVGVFPVIDQYYEPFTGQEKHLTLSLDQDRKLPGINLNTTEQLALLDRFSYNEEIIEISNLPASELNYSFNKGPFLSGDAEMLYNVIRFFKPRKIIEVGCGYSSLMMQHAIAYNKKERQDYACQHICIEPFENAWLEKLDVTVVRQKVEDVHVSLFQELGSNDILFIDSSHIIRPQGDVLFEYLEVLPQLKPGVIIHIHDIFTPKDYLKEWLTDGLVFWNEQYLLEAFLSCNDKFKVILALNYLKHNYYNELSAKCPKLLIQREPGSFWIQKT